MDLDGVPDACDRCPGDNPDDSDRDGVCDIDDACPGEADTADRDGDGAPDACDPCPDDAGDDSDGDGSCDSEDLCAGEDDSNDSDGDGIPDLCDNCPEDNPNDSDLDGVCDSEDLCRESDDYADADLDGIPDGCDNCPADENPDQDDTDGDGVGDACEDSRPECSLVTELSCSSTDDGVELTWSVGVEVDVVEIYRDGVLIESATADAGTYLDETVTVGSYVYGARARCGPLPPTPTTNCAVDHSTSRMPIFIRGDVDGSVSVDLTDALNELTSIFLGGYVLVCDDAADVDDSGVIDLSDPIRILTHTFLGTEEIPEPYVDCGTDPTDDDLGCEISDGCP